MFTFIYTLNNLLLLDAFIKMYLDIRFIKMLNVFIHNGCIYANLNWL